MGTDYRSTGQQRGDYQFDDSLEAQIGQPTKASQYNNLEENTNFLFMSTMHGRRGHTAECDSRGMYECESGRIWVFGKFTGTSERQIITLFNPVVSGQNVTIPSNLTGRILTAQGSFALFHNINVPNSIVDSYLPGGNNDEYLWNSSDGPDYRRGPLGGMVYTGEGLEPAEDDVHWNGNHDYAIVNMLYFGGDPVGSEWAYLYIYIKRTPNVGERFLRAQLHTQNTVYTKCAFALDIAYSPRIPYRGEGS